MCLNEKSHFKSQVKAMNFCKTEKSQSNDFDFLVISNKVKVMNFTFL
jgi:hypothetical protein